MQVEFLYEDTGGLPRDLAMPGLEEMHEERSKLQLHHLRRGQKVVIEKVAAGVPHLVLAGQQSFTQRTPLLGSCWDPAWSKGCLPKFSGARKGSFQHRRLGSSLCIPACFTKWSQPAGSPPGFSSSFLEGAGTGAGSSLKHFLPAANCSGK